MTSEPQATAPDPALAAIFAEAQGHYEQGRLAQAEVACQRLLDLRPQSPSGRFLLAQICLAQGRWTQGWPLYEARLELLAALGRAETPDLPYPRWEGEPLAGKRLLVWTEQGLGDQIQFARYIPALVKMGAQVSMVVPPELETLFGHLGADIIAVQPGVRIPMHDYWVYPGSLAGRLGLPVPRAPYLPSHPPALPVGRIGVVWQGDPRHPNDAQRSFGPGVYKPLLALGLEMVALAPEHSGAKDLEATARLIDNLDAVVTVDTAVAHLAGAMGRPVHLALPFLRTDWRWMRDRPDSPLYPSAKLYRQGPDLDWDPVIAAIAAALAADRHVVV